MGEAGTSPGTSPKGSCSVFKEAAGSEGHTGSRSFPDRCDLKDAEAPVERWILDKVSEGSSPFSASLFLRPPGSQPSLGKHQHLWGTSDVSQARSEWLPEVCHHVFAKIYIQIKQQLSCTSLTNGYPCVTHRHHVIEHSLSLNVPLLPD